MWCGYLGVENLDQRYYGIEKRTQIKMKQNRGIFYKSRLRTLNQEQNQRLKMMIKLYRTTKVDNLEILSRNRW